MESIPLYGMESVPKNMTTTKVILRGCGEESDPLKICVCGSSLPNLEIIAAEEHVYYKFTCPVCGTETPLAFGYVWAKKMWNGGHAEKIAHDQKRIGDF